MSKIVVRIAHVIPVMDYGNTTLEATLEKEISEGDDEQLWLESVMDMARNSLSETLLPMVNAECERCLPILIKEDKNANADNWMRRNSKMYQWFKLVYPEVGISVMKQFGLAKELAVVMDKLEEGIKFDRDDLEAYKDMN